MDLDAPSRPHFDTESDRREQARLAAGVYEREVPETTEEPVDQTLAEAADELDESAWDPEPLPEPSANDDGLTRDQRRSRRARAVRGATISVRAPRGDLRVGLALYPEQPGVDYARPRTRAECVDGPRPCPFVSCQHHLFIDVMRNGSMKVNFPDLEPDELVTSCALDVADRGGATLDEVARSMNLTRERVRQIEAKAGERIVRRHPELRLLAQGESAAPAHALGAIA